jgi:hypothetical protein
LDELIAALEALGRATGVARSAPAYALVSGAHVLGIALLLGPILLVDLHLIGALRRLEAPALAFLRQAAALGVGLTLGTGVLLFAARPYDYAGNPAMRLKLLLVFLAVAHALLMEWRWRRPGGGRRAAGCVSLVLWLGALALGRWIAFV